MDWVYYAAAGSLTGFVVGLTGIGGGALMTPILLMVFGIAPTVAIATDLWFATFTKLAALSVHHRRQQVIWPIVRRLWSGSLPAALLVVMMMLFFNFSNLRGSIITFSVGIIIVLTAFSLLLNVYSVKILHLTRINRLTKRRQRLLTVLIGSMLGIIVSLTSIGAGALGTVFLLYLYGDELSPQKIVGTDIAHAILLALIAGMGYLIGGYVDFALLIPLLCGAIPAAMLGSYAASSISQKKLRFVLAIILAITGMKLIHTTSVH